MARMTLAAVLAMCGAAAAQSAPDESRAEALRKLETLKVSVDFDGTPITDALDYLREVTGLNLVLLPKALEKEPDLKIRLKVRDLTVKSVLKLMLGQRGLAASYRDGALVIVPKEDLNDGVTMKIVDVRSMLVRLQDFAGPKVELVNSGPTGPTPVFQIDEPKGPPVDEDFLVQLVKENTGGGTWESNSKAAISLTNGMLVVSQTPRVHREVEDLLRRLGQFR